jgi:hypothetical protein
LSHAEPLVRRVEPERWRKYDRARAQGMSKSASGRAAGISWPAVAKYEAGDPTSSGMKHKLEKKADTEEVVSVERLSKPARRALDDFAYFRRRYMGRIATPWQEEAAYRCVEFLATPDKEFLVVNCPPGSGKSTLFTHDIPAWLTCRNRAIRCLLGSRTERQARQYTGRLRRTFERLKPVQGEHEMVARGLALDAEATLVSDFGRFRPRAADLWRLDEFIVAQLDDVPLEDKEPTFAAYGMDSGFLGGRYDFVLWDDLVDKTTLRTVEARENQQKWWEEEAETRLEPGGLLILQGQRMSADDLYRHALDMKSGDTEEIDEADTPPKYHHIIYRAHYEDRCTSDHTREALPYPEGCLLDPQRLPWRELKTLQTNRAERFLVLYQQEDLDPSNVLVDPLWIKGGRDKDGYEYPGCWDNDRDLCELPKGITLPLISWATADPSPTKFWSIQWWVYHPETEQRFLMDLVRQSMDAPDFLDWNPNERSYFGLMDSWQRRSIELGIPITTWVIERNAAQRFLLQYQFVKSWQAKYSVDIIGHDTGLNKLDPEYGPQMLAGLYRSGRVRLPGKQFTGARLASMKLVDEVTRWPEGRYDDCVMAEWFLEFQMQRQYVDHEPQPKAWRPSWLREEVSV